MAYLGNDLQVAFPVYRNIDDISGSFNSSATSFPLTVNGVAPVPAPLYSQQCLISVGGVVQRPDDSGSEGFRLSGSNIVFASAPTTGADFFGVILAGADYVDAGGNFPSGTASVPSITFNDDLDTGIFNSGANQISFATGGSERLRIDSAGQIESVSLGTAAAPAFSFTTDPNTGFYSPGADQLAISTNGTGRIFIDSSGRLLVGTSSARTNIYSGGGAVTPTLQLENNTNTWSNGLSIINYSGSQYGASLALGMSASNTPGTNALVTTGNLCGRFHFLANDGTNFYPIAEIGGWTDGTTGTGDVPGRLTFSTTADGASSPTERMRITQTGHLKLSNLGSYREPTVAYNEVTQTEAVRPVWLMQATSGSYAEQVLALGVARAANTAYKFLTAYSGDGTNPFSDLEFKLDGSGNGTCDGSWTGGGADYAEYFEWADNNPDAEDRRGISVVLDGDKIREAVAGEDPIGVISGNPSVVGDAAWNKWNGKYLRDDFGSYLLDENGDRQLSPDFDPDQEYVPREQRPEWDCVGLMGKLRIRKGQITGSRWIKMRDISDSVEEWLVR